MRTPAIAGALVISCTTTVNAAEFRVRFVERVGSTDTIIAGNVLNVADGAPRRIRIQFGVFDDAAGAAPAAGLIGWSVGTITTSGNPQDFLNTRTRGRLEPFTVASGANANGNPPLPSGDPFVNLTDIDATQGAQSPFWGCDASGNPQPQPPALVRGHNTFVSVYEITTDPSSTAQDYAITLGGDLIAATEWRVIGTVVPPDCGDPADPDDDVGGGITYAPFPTQPMPFSATLVLSIPAPGAAGLLSVGALAVGRRRRGHDPR